MKRILLAILIILSAASVSSADSFGGGAAAPVEIDGHATASVSATQMALPCNSAYNIGQSNTAATLTASSDGANQCIAMIAGEASSGFWAFASHTGSRVYLSGNASVATTGVKNATPAIGDSIVCRSFRGASSNYYWLCVPNAGTWATY
jgi:hypothetical protein